MGAAQRRAQRLRRARQHVSTRAPRVARMYKCTTGTRGELAGRVCLPEKQRERQRGHAERDVRQTRGGRASVQGYSSSRERDRHRGVLFFCWASGVAGLLLLTLASRVSVWNWTHGGRKVGGAERACMALIVRASERASGRACADAKAGSHVKLRVDSLSLWFGAALHLTNIIRERCRRFLS